MKMKSEIDKAKAKAGGDDSKKATPGGGTGGSTGSGDKPATKSTD